MVDIAALRESFVKEFSNTPRLFSAPGRVNLIGEHTDYNEGFVLPMAVDRRTVVAAALNNSSTVQVRSLDLGEETKFDLKQQRSENAPRWVNYIEGVARVLIERGLSLQGADLTISSNVPIGSGLSSSAALEISVGTALISVSGAKLDLLELALAAQRAEHEYAGAKVGLMDQLSAAFGQKDHALLIDCRSLSRTAIPLKIQPTEVVVCNTNVKHELAASEYNKRREECERGVQLLKSYLPEIKALRDVNLADFEKHGQFLPDVIKRRCRHVISENDRTLKAADALRRGDVQGFGELMLLSHKSLRDDYEVSSRELDIMVELAMKQDGVAGARMTGGGFGGCTVNLVDKDALDAFRQHISRSYEKETGIEASIYVVAAEDGVKEIAEAS